MNYKLNKIYMKTESQVNALIMALNRYWNLVQTARCVLGFSSYEMGSHVYIWTKVYIS